MVETNLAVLLLKNNILFPYNEIRIEINSQVEKKLIENACKNNDNQLLLINLIDPLEENPNAKDLPNIGVVGKIKSKLELSNGSLRIVLVGLERVSILNYLESDYGYLEAFVIPIKETTPDSLEIAALRRVLFKELNRYIEISSLVSNNVIGRTVGIDDIGKLTDIVCFELPLEYTNKLNYLKTNNPITRIKNLINDLDKEIETSELENEIELSLKEKIDASQREYLLREKIRIIKEELGESTIKDTEIENLKRKISEKNLPDKIKNRLLDELKRYTLSSESSPEVTIIRTYIDWLLALPWCEEQTNNYKVKRVNEVLNESHYGLESIKTRIAEFVIVMDKIKDNSTIICLVGPPGVGKTTLA